MARSISGPLPFSPKVALAKANKAAERLGVHFDGDEENGEFHGAGFRGHYEFVDDTITLTVTDSLPQPDAAAAAVAQNPKRHGRCEASNI